MQFFGSLAELPGDFGPSAVTIGKFDGVHAGHRRVITQLCEAAEPAGLVSTVLTFDRHPLALLNPEKVPTSLTSAAQKREILESTGVGALVMVEFTEEFSQLSAEDFIKRVLVDAVRARVVFVGVDFRFGHRGRGDVDLLVERGRDNGFDVHIIEPVRPEGDRVISSSWIRDLLSEGRVDEAAKLLERLPSVRGEVVHGEQRGRALGYPTANLSANLEGFIPADGIYAAHATVGGRTMPAAVSIGNNPTFDGVAEKQVEAHILDEDLDLYGATLEISFVEYIRGMAKFDSVPDLVAQIGRDEARTREILKLPASPKASH